jgi:FtsZ-interacting cell division protein ZipA
MTELQIILLVCAVVFVGALYWWGKKNNQQQMQRPFTNDAVETNMSEQEDFEVVRLTPKAPPAQVDMPTVASIKTTPAPTTAPIVTETLVKSTLSNLSSSEQDAIATRLMHTDSAISDQTAEIPVQQAAMEPIQPIQNQIFALLVLSPSRELSRKQVHAAMEASRLSFHQDGTYIHRDAMGNVVFRVANVVEPGFFPSLDDEHFGTPGIALVLELPSSITPYRAMDEFITVARKVSQNVGGKLYDAQRHLIKESDLKAMREYAQSLTY